MAAMTPQAFYEALIKAGVVTEAEASTASRIVIDCQSGGPVEIYVQRYGDAHALALLAPLLGEMIRRGEDTAGLEPGGKGAVSGG